MGNTSSMLTQYDIEEVQQHCKNAFTQQEIVSLYQRFCQLDRNNCGFIPSDEFLSIPEFAVNPLSQSLLRMLDGLNFKEFVAFLSAFSPRATLHHKIEFIFKVYDTDCNGKVTFHDMLRALRDLSGPFMSEQQREDVLTQVLEEAGYAKDSSLVLSDFMKLAVARSLIFTCQCVKPTVISSFGPWVIISTKLMLVLANGYCIFTLMTV
ncbi:hypothetical protein GLYMA_17G071900v4 [Glycine max]|uniref:EF-hand domain-containing protein n=1 Tax=Glycine max TaxID=3847 RepID=I1MT03_SOYBN|nr:calcineurin subunit B-like isoform X1 [Glycine soja]KAH1117239.1 hypothetical protein GYH30_046523 [Glycine max]KRH03015.1 hypothetical protein GLYMA_17G071900v4 [Glycine max]|eukprot:XP_025982076.1 calcium-binding EF-hand family protein isoform X1 [Glycine max]